MIMIFHQALYAFLISIFGPTIPCQAVLDNPNFKHHGTEIRAEKDSMIARPMELIDGSYVVKK